MCEKASLAVTVKQTSGSGGSGMTGLDAPVSWLFSAANMANYTDAFVKSNLLPANEGTGYISYTHTYSDQTGIDDPDCALGNPTSREHGRATTGSSKFPSPSSKPGQKSVSAVSPGPRPRDRTTG